MPYSGTLPMQISAMEHLPPPGERLLLGDLLRRIREGNRVSVDRLAQASGKSAKGLQEVEAGALSLSLRQLGTILGALRALIGKAAAKRPRSGLAPADLRFEFLRQVLGSAEFPREEYLRFLAERLEIDMELLVASPFLEAKTLETRPKQSLAEGLRELRHKSKLSLEQLAEQLQLSPATLERIESGQANLSLSQLGDLMEVFAKYSPDRRDASKSEQDRLLAAFKQLDPTSRSQLLEQLEQIQGGAQGSSGKTELLPPAAAVPSASKPARNT
jgi:transcriptional regulator with XRE-family HTH domain